MWGGAACADACPGAKLCDTTLGCVDCRFDTDCGDADPRCVLGRCRECASSADCSAGQACHPRDHTCKPTCADNADCTEDKALLCDKATGACVGCITADDCGAQPFCDATTGQCADCLESADCSLAEPFCDIADGECKQCLTDAHCGANEKCDGDKCVLDGPCTANGQCPNDKLCNLETGACVDCLGDGDCGNGGKPLCSLDLGQCVECLLDEDCDPDKMCNADGKCN